MVKKVRQNRADEEQHHYQCYLAGCGASLDRDPNQALASLLKVTLNFAMPGAAIAGYDEMSEVVRRAGIFCARQYQEIVEELLAFWKIDAISGLSAIGRQAQEKLMKIPARLARMADFQDAKSAIRDFGFDFIYGRKIG